VKHYLLVGNPTAQSGKNAERIEQALALFERAGTKATSFSTLPRGETIAALAAHLLAHPSTYDAVVAMGGDGTFREVGAAILELPDAARPPLAMLPTGTANDQGKSFGLAATEEALPRNVGVALAGFETRLDAGIVKPVSGDGNVLRKDVFFDSLSWGLTARVLHVRNKDREAVQKMGPLQEVYRDHLVYAGAFVRTFLESYVETDKFQADVVVDGERTQLLGLTDLVLKATRVFAGSWVLDRGGAHDDGRFELVPFVGKRDWASKALVALDGNPVTEDDLNEVGIEHSRNVSGAEFDLTFTPEGNVPVYAQMDGEEYVLAPRFRVRVLPRALRLIVPAPER
jgi:diacylglycerol kinase family enzyme